MDFGILCCMPQMDEEKYQHVDDRANVVCLACEANFATSRACSLVEATTCREVQ